MASPLSIFRKYQYALLVVFGVMLMIAFVIAPPILDYQRVRSEGATNTPVVTWKGGELREHDLQGLILSRNLARVFMENLLQQTMAKNGYPRVPRVLASVDEEDVVRNVLLAERAEKLGMRVSDEAIMAYLEQLSAELFSRAEIGEIFRRALGGRMSEAQLFEILRAELLAQNYIIMMHPSLFLARGEAVTPYTAWQYHERLRRRIQAEVVPLEVASFKAQVKAAPTEAQIQALYEEGKDRYPDPDRPEPGFRVPRKIAFQYVRGDVSAFEQEELESARKTVTDAEIKEHYEANKQRYTEPPATVPSSPEAPSPPDSPQPDSEAPPPAPAAPTADDAAAPESPALSAPSMDAPAAPSPPSPSEVEPAAPSDQAPPPAAPAPPAEDAESSSPPETSEPAPTEPAPTEQPAPVEEAPAASDADNSGANRSAAAHTVFVHFLEEAEAESAAAAATTGAATSAAPSPEMAAESEAPAAGGEPAAGADTTPPAVDAPVSEASPAAATEETEPAPPEAAKTAADMPAEAAAPTLPALTAPAAPESTVESPGAPADGSSTAPPAAEPQPRPLDETLMAEIREELAKARARKAAQSRVEKALAEVKHEVDVYSRKLRQSEGPLPKPLDLEGFASQRGLTTGKTPLVDAREVQQYELGRSFELVQFAWPPQRQEFSQAAYQEGVELYRAAQIQGENRDVYYLYWRVEQREPYVPELAQIRDQVIEAWKQREALAIATAEAEKLAEIARKAGGTLKEALADRTDLAVKETNAFSWLSTGFTAAGMGAPGLSFVDNVEGVGEGFMEAVHRLKAGQTGIAVNEPQDRVYVVHVVSESPGIEELRKQFLEAGRSYEVQQIASISGQQYLRQWYENLEQELQVTWHRRPQM